MTDKRLVYWEREDKLVIITIDNPPLNVLSFEVMEQLEEVLRQVAADPEISVVIVTGAGEKAFVAGADIKGFPSMMEMDEEDLYRQALRIHRPFNLLDSIDKPVIAAVNGLALGGGCELALACDIRIMEEQALIGLPEIKLGIFPGGGGTQRLPRLIGEARAKEMMFTGEPITAEEALRIGLVNRVVPQGQALASAKELAGKIAGMSLPALTRIKKCVDEGLHLPILEGMAVEAKYFAEIFKLEDAREGIHAFIEKRVPRFANR
ncbi:enoyl-CoA hydratase/isomerase family protein [Effusibacillus lacus]|uniref:Enoyl-CoA hydratase n=1 Tax=Effusibacillus lacus TaxID=1348429 RepID=A0A292YPC4_9BACL|nr:enoyl-CoA hydratase [Effusibacillus lacus]TCS72038.1 short chain enoyl-CoA hydratase [Effusibacillus lacus]GAX90330.1 enoyl-CoA hydratase [Effusibacillus lacus]